MQQQLQLLLNTLMFSIAVSFAAVNLEEIRISSLGESQVPDPLRIIHLRSL